MRMLPDLPEGDRAAVRLALLAGAGHLEVFDGGDGVWVAEVKVPTGSVFVEGYSVSEVLRLLATIVEEA